MSKELFDAVQMLAQEKGIPEDYLYEKISAAIVVAAKHDYNGKDIVHCDIDPEKQRFKVYVTKNVVEEVEDPDTDLTLEEAQAIKKSAKVGKTIDIHSGGKDLIFPHHENEIAQSECANGCTFANYWLHNGFLTIDNEKMSKSKGNFFMVRDAAKVYGYETIRMFMLSGHYRSPINYSEESLIMAKNALTRLYTAAENLQFLLDHQTGDTMTADEQAKVQHLQQYRQKFMDAMDDDLNTADALAAIFELVREINTEVKDPACTHAFVQACFDLMMELCGVLGLVDHLEKKDIDSEVEELIAQRAAAKKAKNFAEADRIRDYLLNEKGIVIKDTRQGTQWSYKED